MQAFDLNRRQFLQLGAGVAWAAKSAADLWASDQMVSASDGQVAQIDPHLTLAARHGFVDHDLRSWEQSTRLCGCLSLGHLSQLRALLGEDGRIETEFPDGREVWVTLKLQAAALPRICQSGLRLFTEHMWGAPWSDPTRWATQTPLSPSPSTRRATWGGPWASSGMGSDRLRLLIIDHGFPMQQLQHLGVRHLHLSNAWPQSQSPYLSKAKGHAAQVTGLLMQGVDGVGPVPSVPLVLAELPDEILTSMPHAALWPEVLAQVNGAISSSPPGCEWIIMLSLVSTDADRHPQSLISRSARALTAYARSKGVTLTWVMAAGNSHADQQNVDLKTNARHPAEMSWYLPPENFRPSFLECWHEASMGQPTIQIQAPGGGWSDRLEPVTCASRIHGPSSRVQTVLRLPPTAAWTPAQTLAPSGEWGVRFVFEREGLLNLHLAMMTATPQGLLRQARIHARPSRAGPASPPHTLSGLIPFVPQLVVAQTLEPNSARQWVERPASSQLSGYCGRWTQGNPDHGRTIGFKVDASKTQPGALTWSRHGHRILRATGTSMAVPLAARWLLNMT